jgi:uncharacterized integral membrane protein
MRMRNVLYLAVGILLLCIVLINWHIIAQSTELDLLFVKVNAPLGVLILLIGAGVFVVDYTVHSLNRLSWSRERRELNAQIERQRLLADEAEASRLRALTEKLESEMAAVRAQLEALAAAVRAQR